MDRGSRSQMSFHLSYKVFWKKYSRQKLVSSWMVCVPLDERRPVRLSVIQTLVFTNVYLYCQFAIWFNIFYKVNVLFLCRWKYWYIFIQAIFGLFYYVIYLRDVSDDTWMINNIFIFTINTCRWVHFPWLTSLNP